MTMQKYKKDPGAKLDYVVDFAAKTNGTDTSATASDYLDAGETIVDHDVVVPAGLTLESSDLAGTNTQVVIWLSGGTVGEKYTVTARITTSNSPARVDERSFILQIVEK